MQVLFMPSWYPADPSDLAGSFFREQAISLHNAGVKVGVIAASLRSLRNPKKAFLEDGRLRKEVDEGVVTYRASAINFAPRVDRAIYARLNALTRQAFNSYVIENGLPDLIHVHSVLRAGAVARDLSRTYDIPFILSEHSSAFSRDGLSRLDISYAKKSMKNASRLFAVSTPFARLLERQLEFEPGVIEVMPNSVDGRFFSNPIAERNPEKFHFLHVSLLDENKNVATLLNAFAHAFKDRHEVMLTIGGEGPTKTSLERQVSDLGIAAQVRFTGALSREAVVEALSQADAFVLPSRHETFGVVVVEALAMGVPVIATRCGGPEDIIAEGDGKLIPVDDVSSLAQAMLEIEKLTDHTLRTKRRERCRTRYYAGSIARQWISIYEDVLRAPRRAT